MKTMILLFLFSSAAGAAFAQKNSPVKIDSIFFHLYTDSLKTGQNNYINVDGKLSDGTWLPLTSREIEFSSSAGKFEGNELVIPHGFKPEKVTIKAVLRSNPALKLEKTIWIKKLPDPEKLPTSEDILREMKQQKKNKNL
jgi:hypothetical protein